MGEFTVDVTVNDDEIIDYVKKNYGCEDVFPVSELEDWAENNGFVREEA
jgi:hypothetical protein